MGKNEKIILILKSMSTNYPILQEKRLELQTPILLIVEDGKMQQVINLLLGVGSYLINEYSRVKYITEAFANTNSSCIIYPFSHSRKGLDFLNFLATCIKVGDISGTRIGAMLIVISEGIPQGCNMKDLFTIYLDGDLDEVYFEEMIEVPPDEQIPVVFDKISSLLTGRHRQYEEAFLSAVCFLYPNFKLRGQEDEYEKIIFTAKELVDKNENMDDTTDLEEVFLNNLYNWQDKNRFHDVYRLPNLEWEIIAKINRIMLFNEKFLFMKESFFKIISIPLLRYFTVGMLKSKLTDANILCPENVRTYTVKVGYFDSKGIYYRERMLRFDRKRLRKVGELDFIDLCSCVEAGEGYET